MLLVNELRNYITLLKDEIPEITDSQTVMDDSQLSKFLKDQPLDAVLIVGIIPKHKPIGSTDSLVSQDQTSILLLNKVDRAEMTHDAFLDNIHRMQAIARNLTNRLRDDADDDECCSFMRYLKANTLDINPIWGLNSCDGYQIDFSLHTNF
jgi:hypothetical protein